MAGNAEMYEAITEEIVSSLENNIVPWAQPWKNLGNFRPINAASGKPYRGINTLILWARSAKSGFGMNRWLTFNQALDLGGNVRKGEKGTKVIFWKLLEKENKKTGEKDKIPLARVYTVFNVAQCENLDEKIVKGFVGDKTEVAWEDSVIEEFISKVGATIEYGGDTAAYSISRDVILLPEKHQFSDAGAFYATMFHEMTHWTGHNNRCKRHLGERFGTEAYAAEELIAEIGSAFLCAEFGVSGKLQHPSYVKNWIKILKGDKQAIFTAAKHAQEAADYLIGKCLSHNLSEEDSNTQDKAA